MGAHTNTWDFWLSAALPIVICVVLLVFLLRKQLRERQQRIWMAGFIVVLCVIAAGVGLLAQASMDALVLVGSAFILALSILVLWRRLSRRHHAGALLLDLELGPSRTGWWSSPWLWYGLTVFFAGLGLLYLLSSHHPLWPAWPWSVAFCSLVLAQMAQGRRRLEVRERGLVLSPSGYIPWKRIISYTLGDTTLTMRFRSWFGASSVPSQIALRCSPEQRQALAQLLSQYVPATPAGAFER